MRRSDPRVGCAADRVDPAGRTQSDPLDPQRLRRFRREAVQSGCAGGRLRSVLSGERGLVITQPAEVTAEPGERRAGSV